MNGLLNAREFRDTVLQARHRYVEDGGGIDLGGVSKRMPHVAIGVTGQEHGDVVPLLTEIRDSLHRIEKKSAM